MGNDIQKRDGEVDIEQLVEFLHSQVEISSRIVVNEHKLGRIDYETAISWSGREACANDILEVIRFMREGKYPAFDSGENRKLIWTMEGGLHYPEDAPKS